MGDWSYMRDNKHALLKSRHLKSFSMLSVALGTLVFFALSLHAAAGPLPPLTIDSKGKILERLVVQKGDTLWKIATRYKVSIDALNQYNDLKDAQVYIDQVLLIPLAAGTASQTGDKNGSIAELIRKGDTHRNKKEFSKAVECYTAALEADPRHFDALFGAGFSKLKLGEPDEAIRFFVEAVRVEPYNARPHYNLGLVFVSLNNKNAAFEQYRILKSLNGDMATRLLMYVDGLK
jgi:tetratricopeptide (TPR) repeat protein